MHRLYAYFPNLLIDTQLSSDFVNLPRLRHFSHNLARMRVYGHCCSAFELGNWDAKKVVAFSSLCLAYSMHPVGWPAVLLIIYLFAAGRQHFCCTRSTQNALVFSIRIRGDCSACPDQKLSTHASHVSDSLRQAAESNQMRICTAQIRSIIPMCLWCLPVHSSSIKASRS